MTHANQCEPYIQLRARYVRAWIRMIGSSLLAMLCLLIPSESIKGTVFVVCITVFVASWVQALVSWFRILRWPCPRCGKSFVWGGLSTWPTDHCKHCQLSVNDE